MAGTVWIPAAQQLSASGTSGTMLGGPPRAVWHTTEAPSGGDFFDAMHRVLTSKKAEPHILYDPLTDRLGQYFPLNRSSRALRNDAASGTSTNRTGVVCIQIEVVAYASKPFTDYWKPGPNFDALMAAIRSWGIPDVWPAGRLSRAGEDVSRSLSTYQTEAGHYGHCNVPGNTHWDPGAIDQQVLFTESRTPLEDDVPLTDPEIERIAQRTRQVVADGRIRYGLDSLLVHLLKIEGQLAGVAEAVAQLDGGGGLDGAAITDAAQRGAEAALAELGEKLTNDAA